MQANKEQLNKVKTKLKIINMALYVTYGVLFISFWGLFILAGVAFDKSIIIGLGIIACMALLVFLASKAIGKLNHQIKVQEANVSRLNSKVFFENMDKQTKNK
jgi:hypothetical protein